MNIDNESIDCKTVSLATVDQSNLVIHSCEPEKTNPQKDLQDSRLKSIDVLRKAEMTEYYVEKEASTKMLKENISYSKINMNESTETFDIETMNTSESKDFMDTGAEVVHKPIHASDFDHFKVSDFKIESANVLRDKVEGDHSDDLMATISTNLENHIDEYIKLCKFDGKKSSVCRYSVSEQSIQNIMNFMRSFRPGHCRNEDGSFIPLIHVSLPESDQYNKIAPFCGIQVQIVKDIARNTFGYLVTKVFDLSPLYSQLYAGHVITKMNNVPVDGSCSFESFYMRHISDASNNLLEVEHLPLRQLVAFPSGDPISKNNIDSRIVVRVQMPRSKMFGMEVGPANHALRVVQLEQNSIYRGHLFKNDHISSSGSSYFGLDNDFIPFKKEVNVGDIFEIIALVEVPEGAEGGGTNDGLLNPENLITDVESTSVSHRHVKFPYSTSLGLILSERPDLGGLLVVSKSKECCIHVNSGEVLLKLNKHVLQGRTVLDFMTLLKETDERRRNVTVKTYERQNKYDKSQERRHDNASLKLADDKMHRYGEVKRIQISSSPVNFECKESESNSFIVSYIDYAASVSSGINIGDMIIKIDGHSVQSFDKHSFKHMIVSTMGDVVVEVRHRLDIEENNTMNDSGCTLHDDKTGEAMQPIPISTSQTCFEPTYIARVQSSKKVSSARFDSMPICYAYIFGDEMSEKVSKFKNKFMKTRKRKMQYERKNFDDVQFDVHVEELRQFREQNGHCRVPNPYKENLSLSNWIRDINYSHSLSLKGLPETIRLSEDRLKKLSELGFEFSRCGKQANIPKRAKQKHDNESKAISPETQSIPDSSMPVSVLMSRQNVKFVCEENLGDEFPKGWVKHTYKRISGTKARDCYYFTTTGIRFRSLIDTRRFADILKSSKCDEATAIKLFHRH